MAPPGARVTGPVASRATPVRGVLCAMLTITVYLPSKQRSVKERVTANQEKGDYFGREMRLRLFLHAAFMRRRSLRDTSP